jgi:hypothetical protein
MIRSDYYFRPENKPAGDIFRRQVISLIYTRDVHHSCFIFRELTRMTLGIRLKINAKPC